MRVAGLHQTTILVFGSFLMDIPILLPLLALATETTVKWCKDSKLAWTLPVSCGSIMLIDAAVTRNPVYLIAGIGLYVVTAIPWAMKAEDQRQVVRLYAYSTAVAIAWGASVSLYFDQTDLFYFTPFLGHRAAWAGNHFMWNSGIELFGAKPFFTRIPSYRPFLNFWNLIGLAVLATYPAWLMIDGPWLFRRLSRRPEKRESH